MNEITTTKVKKQDRNWIERMKRKKNYNNNYSVITWMIKLIRRHKMENEE